MRMNSRDICAINFTGLTHDHSSGHVNQLCRVGSEEPAGGSEHEQDDLCSAISILKRHPMYDCLILVKKYRKCLNGHSLEFPIDRIREHERLPTNESGRQNESLEATNGDQTKEASELNTCACSQQRLVSRFLDGDDPIYSSANFDLSLELASNHSTASHEEQQQQQQQENEQEETQTVELRGSRVPFMVQIDERGDKCELVNVPVNGLLDRLENYTRSGVAVDSRVYAFAMGLKTAERMMTTKSMKELQETPI